MQQMGRIVREYGGSSVATAARLRTVAARGDRAKVSLVGIGRLNRSGHAARRLAARTAAIPSPMVAASEISVACVVPPGSAPRAARQLRDTSRRDFVAADAPDRAPGISPSASGPDAPVGARGRGPR